MNESTGGDVLDAVTLELSRFTRDVVAEMHRLRDELIVERLRTDRLEATVQSLSESLRKFDTQAAEIVDHVVKLSAEVDRRLDNVGRRMEPAAPGPAALRGDQQSKQEDVADELVAGVGAGNDDDIYFAPLTLTLAPVEAVPHDTTIDDLVARVVGAIADPRQLSETIERANDLVEADST